MCVCVYVYTVVCLPGSLFDFISYATLKQKTTLQNYFQKIEFMYLEKISTLYIFHEQEI